MLSTSVYADKDKNLRGIHGLLYVYWLNAFISLLDSLSFVLSEFGV